MTIAVIAGTGGVPPRVVAALVAQGREPLICEMRGFVSEVAGEHERLALRIETLGTFLQALTDRNITEVCMVGAMSRPTVNSEAIDAATAPLVPRLQAAMARGDDGTLREIVAIFQDHGFSVVGAHEIAPDLLPPAGVLTQAAPPDVADDLAAARAALAEMGRADSGQAMLVRDGKVIAREDARGTKAMLQDFSDPPDDHSGSGTGGDVISVAVDAAVGIFKWLADAPNGAPRAAGTGAFLYKAPKPGQILAADMPLIGPETAMQAAEAGLSGIVIPQGGVMVLDLAQVVAILDAQQMYLWVTP